MMLSKAQLDELQRALRRRLAEFDAEIREDVGRERDESFAEVSGSVHDSADEAVADVISDMDHAEVSRDLREMREIEAALSRIAGGSYGTCAQCGKPIGFERLRAQPTALRCFDCQRVYEKTTAQAGHPKI